MFPGKACRSGHPLAADGGCDVDIVFDGVLKDTALFILGVNAKPGPADAPGWEVKDPPGFL